MRMMIGNMTLEELGITSLAVGDLVISYLANKWRIRFYDEIIYDETGKQYVRMLIEDPNDVISYCHLKLSFGERDRFKNGLRKAKIMAL